MARPPGDWDKHKSVLEFDLNDSRKRGWCLYIVFAAPDPVDGADEVSFMLSGFSYPYFTKEEGDFDQIRYVYDRHALDAKPSPFKTVVGVLAEPDAPVESASKKIAVGTYLVMGDAQGDPLRTFRVPIKSIVQSYVDDGQ